MNKPPVPHELLKHIRCFFYKLQGNLGYGTSSPLEVPAGDARVEGLHVLGLAVADGGVVVHAHRQGRVSPGGGVALLGCGLSGVDINGAAAKVMNLDSLGKKVRPGTFGKITGVPKRILC